MNTFIQLIISGVTAGMIYGLVAIGIIMIYKSTKVFNLAQGSILLLGAFIFYAYLVQLSFPFPLALLATLATSVLLGMAVERFTQRPLIGQPIHALVMVTVALMALLEGLVYVIWGTSPVGFPEFIPSLNLRIAGFSISLAQILTFVITLVLIAVLSLLFNRTRWGLAMRATAEDHQLAQSSGVSVKGVFSYSWALCFLVAVIGGIFLSNQVGLNTGLSVIGLKVLSVVILGGLESIPGAILGGLIIGLFESLAGGYIDPYVGGGIKEVAPFIAMMIILLIRPYGLFGYEEIERV